MPIHFHQNKKKVYLILLINCLIIFLLGYIAYQKFNEYKYNKIHANDIEWAVLSSEAFYTNRKKSGTNLGVNTFYVKSPQNKDFITAFYDADGHWLRTLDGSGALWGRGATPLGGNDFKQALPARLKLTYFSTSENQFYQLDTSLPQEKIKPLFTTVHRGMGDQESPLYPNVYKTFDIGITPEGWVILFAVGPGTREEIGAWQAKKIEVDYDIHVASDAGGELEWIRKQNYRKSSMDMYFSDLKKFAPKLYQNYIEGKGLPKSGWFKKMQTKYPWNFEVTAVDGTWSGEYYAEYANTERFEVLDDRLQADKTRLKPVPVKLQTWVTYKTGEKYFIEIHFFPMPKWTAKDYIPYYQDPNLDRFFKNFQDFYPQRSLATNNQPAYEYEFSTIKIDLDDNFIIKDIYLQKGKEKKPLDGAYEYYLAPVDVNRGFYFPETGHPHFLTQPKTKDLSDPAFVDLD